MDTVSSKTPHRQSNDAQQVTPADEARIDGPYLYYHPEDTAAPAHEEGAALLAHHHLARALREYAAAHGLAWRARRMPRGVPYVALSTNGGGGMAHTNYHVAVYPAMDVEYRVRTAEQERLDSARADDHLGAEVDRDTVRYLTRWQQGVSTLFDRLIEACEGSGDVFSLERVVREIVDDYVSEWDESRKESGE